MRMRFFATQLEALAPASFIIVVGLAGGVLQGVPSFFFQSTSSVHVAQVAALAVISVLWWAAAVLFWWIAVRRRRYSIWKTAWHVTLAWALADVLELGLDLVHTSIQTKGAFVEAVARTPLDFALTNLELILIRSAVRFLGAVILVALGRQLPGSDNHVAPQPSTSTNPEAIA